MGYMVGIDPDYDYLFDPQQAMPSGFCRKCGGEVYRDGKSLCWECEEAEEDD